MQLEVSYLENAGREGHWSSSCRKAAKRKDLAGATID